MFFYGVNRKFLSIIVVSVYALMKSSLGLLRKVAWFGSEDSRPAAGNVMLYFVQ